MKKFIFRSFLCFSLIFIVFFIITMSLEYKNKDKIKSDVNVEVKVVDGKIQVPDTPDKVEANYEFSKSYYYVGTVISIALPLLFKVYGGIEVVKKRCYKHRWTEGIVLVLMFLIFSWITTFPKSFFSAFYRGRLMGLSNYTFSNYILNNVVNNCIDILTSLPIYLLFYVLYCRMKRWYIVVGVITVGLFIGGNYLYPYLDEKVNNLIPMEEGELKDSILELSRNVGIENLEVMVIPKSKETSTINAYMTGIGGSKRIVFWDTTLKQLNKNEILSVAAHEMGHYKLNHITKSTFLAILLTILSLIAVNAIMERRYGKDYRTLDNLVKLIFILNLISIITTPIEMAYSRKVEVEADRFAIEKTGDYYTNGTLEIKFIETNLSPVDVDKIYKLLVYSHPTTKERIELSNSYAKK